MKIYTRKGDDGTTGLWYGGRVVKSGARPEAYGSIDEAAAALGLCRAACDPSSEVHEDVLRIQGSCSLPVRSSRRRPRPRSGSSPASRG